MQHQFKTLTRRSFLASTTALAIVPGVLAQTGSQAMTGWKSAIAAARRLDQIHALVIAHKGDIAVAEVFRGPAVDQPVNVKSVAKTLVAALTGAAIDRGEIAGLKEPLGELIPDLIPSSADPRVAEITLADLVTMQAGLERTSGPNYGEWVSSRNWIANALNRRFVATPGQHMQYSTGSYHILGAALSRTSGKSLLSLARDWIGKPLGIEIPAWTRDPQGFYLGGNEMALSPLAMIYFGEMYRQGGVWDGARVLSQSWVEDSFVARTQSPFSGLDYGYGWFLGELRGRRIALARGYGGQIICIVPELGLTVAITSDPTRPARSGGHFGDLLQLIDQTIISEV